MSPPKVSVIMPAYNQGAYIAEAIASVLKQTCGDWELLVVDDGSTDSTASVVSGFSDDRVKYFHQANKGVSEARNVAIAASSGEYLAFLDADDLFHPDKLEAQVAHLDQNRDLGASYAWRIEIDQAGDGLNFRRATLEASLKDLVLGFPFAPIDLMVRREWMERAGNFNSSLAENEDREFFLRLALSGCQFAGLDRFLAFRRLYSGRVFQKLSEKVGDSVSVLENFFDDARCPPESVNLREQAYRNIHIEWAYQAAMQNNTLLAQTWFRQVVRFDPELLGENPDELLQRLVEAATRDGGEHETHLRRAFAQLPSELECLKQYCNWAVGCGYLRRGVRDMMWGRTETGHAHFNKAAALGAQLDERSLRLLRYQLLNYEAGLGRDVFDALLRNLSSDLEKVGGRTEVRRLNGWYSINRAFRDYSEGKYDKVLRGVTRAVANDPKYLSDRQVLGILPRSVYAWLKP